MVASRVVCKEGVTPDAIDAAAAKLGWQLCNLLPALPHQAAQAIFYTACRSHCVRFVQDVGLGVLYAEVPDAQVRRELEQELPCHTGDGMSLLARESMFAASAPARLGRALAVLVLHAAEPSAAVADALDQFLQHVDPKVRGAALMASRYALWPAVLSSLEHMAQHDEELQLQASARQLLRQAKAMQMAGGAVG